MKMHWKNFPPRLGYLILIIFFLENGYILFPRMKALFLPVETNAAQKGQLVAAKLGCFTCHGPRGMGGVPNPGSEDGKVPGYTGGILMMYVDNEQEIKEYILESMPLRKKEDEAYRQQIKKQAIAMPAFRNYIHDEELKDLVFFIKTVSGLITPDDIQAAQGMDIAYRFGCFACHGEMGAGGMKNPGSLKGYIPGFWGEDFRELVQNEEELREWIRDGSIGRFRKNPIAYHYIQQQVIKMPAFQRFLTAEEIDAVIAYLRWLNRGEWQQEGQGGA